MFHVTTDLGNTPRVKKDTVAVEPKYDREYLSKQSTLARFANKELSGIETEKWRGEVRAAAEKVFSNPTGNAIADKIAKAVSKRQQIEFTETLDADSAALIFYKFGGANRAINNSALTDYIGDMKEGRWVYSALGKQPICVTHDGRLTEGNKRLAAQVISDLNGVEYNFSAGLTADDAAVTGRQQERSAAVNHSMTSKDSSARYNEFIKGVYIEYMMALELLTRTPPSKAAIARHRPSNAVLLKLFDEYDTVYAPKFVKFPVTGTKSSVLGRHLRPGRGQSNVTMQMAMGVYAALIEHYNEDLVLEFFNTLITTDRTTDLPPALRKLSESLANPRFYGKYHSSNYTKQHCQRQWLIDAMRGWANGNSGRLTDFQNMR